MKRQQLKIATGALNHAELVPIIRGAAAAV
jgi:hypothetical protein